MHVIAENGTTSSMGCEVFLKRFNSTLIDQEISFYSSRVVVVVVVMQVLIGDNDKYTFSALRSAKLLSIPSQ